MQQHQVVGGILDQRDGIPQDQPFVVFGKTVGNTQIDDEECTYDDCDDDESAEELEPKTSPASPFLSMISPATSVLGKAIEKPTTESYHSGERIEEDCGDGE